MKKNFLHILFAIVICAILGILSEIFIFNFKTLTINNPNHSFYEISYAEEKDDNGQTELKLNLENKYIKELLIDYEAPEDIDYELKYTYLGLYDQPTDENFSDIFDNSFSVAATNIDNTVSEISILYDSSSELKINRIVVDNGFHFNYFRAFFVFLSMLSVYFLFFFYKKGFCTEKIHVYFAVFCSLIGLMIITAQPAMNFFCWDDQTHFDRVVDLPIGDSEYSNGELNMSDAGTPNHNWHESTDSFTEHRIRSKSLDSEIDSTYTGNKSGTFLFIHKLPYLPMAIGYHLAKAIHLPFIICFQIGKIFNLLFYVLLMTYAIKTIVVGKRLLTVIALIPTNIFLACEYSYDPAVLAGITIFITQIINILLDKNDTHKLSFKTAIVMIASMTYACLAKAVYAPFLLLTLLIPKNKFKNTKQCYLVKTGFIIISILLLGTIALSAIDGSNPSDMRGGNVSVFEQSSLVMSHPLDYATILNENAVGKFGFELFSPNTLVNLSYTYVSDINYNGYYVFLFLLTFVFLTDSKNNKLTKKQRSGFLILNVLVIILIWSALYIDFTPVGLTTINGVQNRYFLPLLLPLLIPLQIPNIQNKINPKYYNLTIFATATITMIFIVYQFILIPYNF